MALGRYRNVNRIEGDGSLPRYYETIDYPTQLELQDVATFKIRISRFDRLDQLAFKHLGAGEYWWVIALMNDLDWMYDFEPGQILKIPISVEDVLRLV